MADKNAEKMKNFACRRCARCCEQAGFVYLGGKEAEETAAFLSLSAFDFVNEYCEIFARQRLVLKKGRDEKCVFLEGKDGRIYSARPAQCRDFPLKWDTPRSRDYCAARQE